MKVIGFHHVYLAPRRAPATGVPMRLPNPEKVKHTPILELKIVRLRNLDAIEVENNTQSQKAT